MQTPKQSPTIKESAVIQPAAGEVPENTSLQDTFKMLANVGVAVIVDLNKKVKGVVSLSDLPSNIQKVVDDLKAAKSSPPQAQDLLNKVVAEGSPGLPRVNETDPLEKVAEVIVDANARPGVPVVDADGTYKGFAFAPAVKQAFAKVVNQFSRQLDRTTDVLSRMYPDSKAEILRLRHGESSTKPSL